MMRLGWTSVLGLGMLISVGLLADPPPAFAIEWSKGAPPAPFSGSSVPSSIPELDALQAGADAYAASVLEQGKDHIDGLSLHQLLANAQRSYKKSYTWRARRQAKGAIAAGSDTGATWLLLARINAKSSLGSPDTAMAAWQAQHRLTQASVRSEALTILGNSLLQGGDKAEAIAILTYSLALQPDALLAHRLDVLTGRVIEVKSTDIDGDREVPQACVTFTTPLNPELVDYRPYVAIEPDVRPALQVDDKTLCVEGLNHGTIYQITLRQGLPARSGAALAKNVPVAINVPNREPRLIFTDKAYILPRLGSVGVPVRSINLRQARLTLFRVVDRSLVAKIREGWLGQSLDGGKMEELAETSGEQLWQGTIDLRHKPNQEMVTAIPLAELLPDRTPGIHILTAEPIREDSSSGYNYWEDRATQWVVLSDLGLTTFEGRDGLVVAARSYESGGALEGIQLSLLARNNKRLGEAVTDQDGLARFAPGLLRGTGGNRVMALMAYSPDGDFAMLDVTRPSFDLSDRGVSGRRPPGPVDAFLYSDRGIYRPGESVHLTALLRDQAADAIAGAPLALSIRRPDGVETARFTPDPEGAGGRSVRFDLPDTARTGQWSVRAILDPDSDPVGQLGFQVEDFRPPTIELALSVPEKAAVARNQPVDVTVNARYLYDAPGIDLAAEGMLTLEADPAPYPDFKAFQFGLAGDSFSPRSIRLESGRTDGRGNVTLSVAVTEMPDSSQPLRARVRATVFETGGSAVSRSVVLPVRTAPRVIGIRPQFGDELEEGKEARFDVVALSADGTPQAGHKLFYTLYREEHRYHWYQRYGSWQYRRQVSDRRVASGRIETGPDGRAEMGRHLPWGRYRLEVYEPDGAVASSKRFHAGWYVTESEDGTDTPDTLKIAVEKDAYRVGETARLFIDPPFAGEALVLVADDRILAQRNVSVAAEGTEIEIPVTRDWGIGAYILVTAYRPGAVPGETAGTASPDGSGPEGSGSVTAAAPSRQPRGPGRAVGVAWVGIDSTDRKARIAMDIPDIVQPRRTLMVPLSVSGLQGPAYVTLAAVDDAILNMTGFQTPDPEAHYFGKRRLGIEMRDAYGRLIDGRLGLPGRLRSGGDAAASRSAGLTAKVIKPLARFSGIVELDEMGQATIPFDLPHFSGRLRLMAVAWDQHAMGHGESKVIVRDPIVAQVALPRFLAPGDTADVTVNLDNLSAPKGVWSLDFQTRGTVSVSPARHKLSLAAKGRDVARFQLTGERLGTGKISFQLSGPGGHQQRQDWDISVRSPTNPVTVQIARSLESLETVTLDDAALTGLFPETARLSASFTTLPNLDIPGLVAALDRYPYGCLEQTVSRALPLLYVSGLLSEETREEETRILRDRVAGAVRRVITMQRSDGGFALWPTGDHVKPWLSGYAMDFLLRAREEGIFVPDFAMGRGLSYLDGLKRNSDRNGGPLTAQIYALHLLARVGRLDPSDLRYAADILSEALPTGLARAQLASALAAIGDRDRAQRLFASAQVTRPKGSGSYDYGSRIRDTAAQTVLGLENGLVGDKVLTFAESLAEQRTKRQYLSTQDQAWLLLAADALVEHQSVLHLAVGSETRGPSADPIVVHRRSGQVPIPVTNLGTAPVYALLSASGVPEKPQPPVSEGVTIQRRYYSIKGEPVDTKSVTQTRLLVAVIEGELDDEESREMLVVDLLPAGFAIENARLDGSASTSDFGWIGSVTSAQHTEIRDDRFVTAFHAGRGRAGFRFAYLVRAVTPGTYGHPGVFVEDMYKPHVHARGAFGKTTIVAR